MTHLRTKEMTVIAMLLAIIIVMAAVPYLGFIGFGAVSITLLHLPVLIGGVYGGRRVGIAVALAFGLSSLAIAWMRPQTPLDFLFQNPLISVLPRFLFGLALWLLYEAAKALFNRPLFRYVFTFALATLAHTLLTLGCVFIFGRNNVNFIDVFGDTGFLDYAWIVLSVILPVNGVLEIVVALLVGIPVIMRLTAYDQVAESWRPS